MNCLRWFAQMGPVVWGTRTARGSDALSDDFKYLEVRRLTDYIELTLLQNMGWVVFAPNDELLWSQIRLAVGAFMMDLFLNGALRGVSKEEAFFVNCDASTTTQDDINRGIVNVELGFAPVTRANFVVLHVELTANKPAA